MVVARREDTGHALVANHDHVATGEAPVAAGITRAAVGADRRADRGAAAAAGEPDEPAPSAAVAHVDSVAIRGMMADVVELKAQMALMLRTATAVGDLADVVGTLTARVSSLEFQVLALATKSVVPPPPAH